MQMIRIHLVAIGICASLLLFVPLVKDVAAIEYFGELLNCGNDALEHGQYSKASFCFGEVLQSYPDNTDALMGKAYALIQLQSYDQSITYLDKVLKIYPNYFDAIFYKAVVLSTLGKHKEAQFYYDQIKKIAPNFPLTETDLKITHGRFEVPYHTAISHG